MAVHVPERAVTGHDDNVWAKIDWVLVVFESTGAGDPFHGVKCSRNLERMDNLKNNGSYVPFF